MGAPREPWTTRWGVPAIFLLPALFFLAVWLVWPTIYTIWRSLYSDRGGEFVGLDNYQRMFNDDIIFTAIRNNALWVLIVPAAVTAVGLVFAVLTERVWWATAFKIAVFMPLAISLFAVGVIWRIMYQIDPDKGVLNAAIVGVQDTFKDQGVLSRARASTEDLTGSTSQGFTLDEPVSPGDTAELGLTAVPASEVPDDAPDAAQPQAQQGAITGVVWRDFKPGGGTPGEVESGESGLAGVTVVLKDESGDQVAKTTTEADGSFAFEDVEQGDYQVEIASSTFAEPFKGFNWLGEQLITPSIMFAYIWVQAGFAMVIIAAGLAAIPRDVLEAARTDGGTEWQVFRRVTVPLLAPVLTVVFVTQVIGVLKVFDLILAIAPAPSRLDATTLAFEMWRRAFSGQNLFGLGSAIATFLFLLFIPFLIVNIRRFRTEAR
ncbi:MAG TPA: ABC transporter permease subunit [Gaiellaceae bacterium]|nr:ABC transporter permease subunit [Gaiellaceae bacterium]